MKLSTFHVNGINFNAPISLWQFGSLPSFLGITCFKSSGRPSSSIAAERSKKSWILDKGEPLCRESDQRMDQRDEVFALSRRNTKLHGCGISLPNRCQRLPEVSHVTCGNFEKQRVIVWQKYSRSKKYIVRLLNKHEVRSYIPVECPPALSNTNIITLS